MDGALYEGKLLSESNVFGQIIQSIIITTIQIWPIKFNMFPEAFAAFIFYSFSSSLVNYLGGGE